MRTDGRAERRTDMTKLIVTFRNSANAPKILIASLAGLNHRPLFRDRILFFVGYEFKLCAYLEVQISDF
jgi:hypothetical protein